MPGQNMLNIHSIGKSIKRIINVHMPNDIKISEDINGSDEPIKRPTGSADGEAILEANDVNKNNPSTKGIFDDTDPKRITVNNYGTVQNQKFVSIETMNGDIHL